MSIDGFSTSCIITTHAHSTVQMNIQHQSPPYHGNPFILHKYNHNLALQAHGDVIMADDEPLSSKFQRAVVLQRAGDHLSALKEYQIFVKAAEQCDVSPEMYAEVHVNMGAIYTKLKDRIEARNNFETALKYREMGSAHVNLALLALAEGQVSTDPRDGMDALKEAEGHCRKAVELDDDVHSVNGATRLLGDIEKMLRSAS